MKPSGKLSLDFFSSDIARHGRAWQLALGVARELDNINQGMLHLGVYRKSPAVKIPYDELYGLYEQITVGQSTKQILSAVPKLGLVVPIEEPSRDTLLNGMIALDVWTVRPGIDFYADHDDTLELPLPIKTDKYGLTIIDDTFRLESQGIIIGDDLVYYHPFLRRFFSARFVDTPNILAHIQKQKNISLKIALDPIRHTQAARLDRTMEFDYWHGAKFDTAKLSDRNYKGVTVHGRKDPTGLLDFTFPLIKTAFYTANGENAEKEFQIEELVPTDSRVSADKKYVLQRYAHFIWDNKEQTFRHFDCAVRIYTKDTHAKRLAYEWKPPYGTPEAKAFKRKKLFRLDGRIELEVIKDLLYAFFRYNELVMEYFGAQPVGLEQT
jgi:hypothetical protein